MLLVFSKRLTRLMLNTINCHIPIRSAVQTSWIEQRLDHFNEKENATWQMRYMENAEYFVSGGPIFILVGGELAISPVNLQGGHLYDMAKEHSGYMYQTEHRYYGDSYPTKDLSTENLKYLNARQALADLAHFIRNRTATVQGLADSKVILVGCSYAGNLVTWFKRLYPKLVTGCWASSAPLQAKNDFYEYRELTGEIIKSVGGVQCYSRIKNGFAKLEEMIANNRDQEIRDLFGLCDTFKSSNEMEIWYLFYSLISKFGKVVQSQRNREIQDVCKSILESDDDLTGLSKYLRSRLHSAASCTDLSYKSVLAMLNNTSLNNEISRGWIYQGCNEFGFHRTTTSDNQPFGKGLHLDGFMKVCADAFDNQFNLATVNRNIAETNKLFGGLNPNVSDVYFTHGQRDPWRAVGLQDANKVQIIPMAAHCQDLGSISVSDSPEMRSSKEKIAELVRKWVKGAK